jgi:cell division protein FtsI (penicillin-binding protein 3)
VSAVPWASGQRWVRVRLLAAAALFVSSFALLGSRAWVLQVRESKRLREMAEEQYLKDVELPSRRGRILDRNGAELAASAEVDSIYINPRQVEGQGDAKRTVAELSRLLHLDKRELERPLGSHRYFAWIKRQVQPDEARAVRELELPGVYLTREPRRYYPNRGLAGALIGWAGVDGRGLEGLELRWDKELRGARAEVPGLRDAFGREVLSAGIGETPAQTGHDLQTTIDKFIQYRLERALEEGVQKSRAKAGVAVALDPRSGEVLAMAAVPGVNPNDPIAAAHGARNRAVTDPFEPGSTMKTFTIAAALEAEVVHPDDHWFCENGHTMIAGKVIHDAEPIGNATTVEVLAKSSNICTAKIARRAGRERVEAMLRRFGFGRASGIDLPGERGGLLRPVKKWGEVELATIAFGQGMTATPLQVAAGYAAIANGGTLYRPHVVRRVLDEKGRAVLEQQPEGRRAIDEKLARTLRGMLFQVTQKGGTGEKLQIAGYPAAGKTGTAQKVDPATRRYSTEKWASSFVGFAPLDDPRLVILVMVDEPAGTHFGSAVAGPIWHDAMADALRYLGVQPKPGDAPAVAQRAQPAPTPVVPVEEALGAELPFGADAPEALVEADPAPGAASAIGEEAETGDDPEPAGEAAEVPDFTGLSLGEALELARRAHLALEVNGSGQVVSQSPGPGRAQVGVTLRLSLAPPG